MGGRYGSLKQITSDVFGLEGKWTSPGGQSKRFTSSNADLTLTWYSGKQNSLSFQGKDGYALRDKCVLYCEEKIRPCKPGGEITILCSNDANKQVDGVVDFQIITISEVPYQAAEEDGQNQGCNLNQTKICSANKT